MYVLLFQKDDLKRRVKKSGRLIMKYIPKSLGLDLIADSLSEVLSIAFLVMEEDVLWFGS